MPYRTQYGKHYHETYGCHGATIPCDAKGLTPCNTCCGKGASGGARDGGPTGGGIASGSGNSIPSGTTVIRGRGREVSLDGTVIETRPVGAGTSAMSQGVLYRLDSKLSDEQVAVLDAMPGIMFMPDEYSLDRTERTSAFIISDMGPKYSVDYASTISDLGIQAMGRGHESPSDIDTKSISAWLASTEESEWDTLHLRSIEIDGDAPSEHIEAGDGWPARTRYRLRGKPSDWDVQMIMRNKGMTLSHNYGSDDHYLVVYDGYEVVARGMGQEGGTKLGIRRHYDTQILRDVSDADWRDSDDPSLPKGTKEATGVAYRTPAGDATIRMAISPVRGSRSKTSTTIRIDDPTLGSPITLAKDVQSGSFDQAVRKVCPSYLADANIGQRGGSIRKEYERALPKLARRKCEEEGIDVRQILRSNDGVVNVIGDEAGYVPVSITVILNDDGSLDTYRR